MIIDEKNTQFRKKWNELLDHRERERLKEVSGKYQGEGNKVNKIKMHTNIQSMACNIRGRNTLGKRQELAEQWEKDKIDVAMLSERQKNAGGIEKGGTWGKYVCFFSTGINPKTRDAQEKIRENKVAKIRERSRKKKKGIEPTPIAKPRKPAPKEDPKQKGKGQR